MTPSLADLQVWMQQHVMHLTASPQSDLHPTRWNCNDVFTGSSRLSPTDRAAVYANAYAARLIECLRLEFPAVRQAAGAEAFDGFAAGYLQSRQSTSYTLADLGVGFSEYLRATRPAQDSSSDAPDFADFLIDLATLERTYSEVFDAAGPERDPGLTTDQLAGIGLDRFIQSRLRFFETVRLLSLKFPCHEFASSVRKNQDIQPIQPELTRLVVFRRQYVVRRMILNSPQLILLSSLLAGETVGEALRHTLSDPDASAFSTELVQQTFADWTAAELIRQIVPA